MRNALTFLKTAQYAHKKFLQIIVFGIWCKVCLNNLFMKSTLTNCSVNAYYVHMKNCANNYL